MKQLWVKKYAPASFEEYCFSNKQMRSTLLKLLAEKDIPHLLLAGAAGTGKSTLAALLIDYNEIDKADVLTVDASIDNNVDTIRDRIRTFVTTTGFGDIKIVLLEECVDENTLVTVLRQGEEQQIPIKELDDKNDLIKSLNVKSNQIEWRTFELMDKGVRTDTLEIEFENGEKVVCTPEHKWYVTDPITNTPVVVRADQLHEFNHILQSSTK